MKKSIGKLECTFDMPKSMSTVWDVFYMISTKGNPIEILEVGTELFQMMSEHISTDKEVEAAENFSSDPLVE